MVGQLCYRVCEGFLLSVACQTSWAGIAVPPMCVNHCLPKSPHNGIAMANMRILRVVFALFPTCPILLGGLRSV